MSSNVLIDFLFSVGANVRTHLPLILLVPVAVMLMGSKGGCKKNIKDAKDQVPDFRGNYEIIHEDTVTVKVKVGAFTKTYHGLHGGIIDLGMGKLNLKKVCKYPGVHCPSEAFWHKVAVNQPFINEHKKPYNPWLLKVTNLDPSLNPLTYKMRKGGLVNKHGNMVLGLGLGMALAGPCAMLGSSVAKAKFSLDEAGYPNGELVNGRVSVSYSGACLFPTQAGFWGSTITIESPFSGSRISGVNVPKHLDDGEICDENGRKLMPPR